MTTDEMVNELKRDVEQSKAFLKHIVTGEFQRVIKKASKFPVQKLYDWKSKSGNHYIIRLSAESKRYIGKKGVECDIAHYALLQDGSLFDAVDNISGVTAFDTEGSIVLVKPKLFIPHFFQRYNERFGLMPQYKDIRHQYVARFGSQNSYTSAVSPNVFQASHGCDAETLTFWRDGISLGVYKTGDMMIFKTYLSNDTILTAKQEEYITKMSQMHLDSKPLYDYMKTIRHNETKVVD